MSMIFSHLAIVEKSQSLQVREVVVVVSAVVVVVSVIVVVVVMVVAMLASWAPEAGMEGKARDGGRQVCGVVL